MYLYEMYFQSEKRTLFFCQIKELIGFINLKDIYFISDKSTKIIEKIVFYGVKINNENYIKTLEYMVEHNYFKEIKEIIFVNDLYEKFIFSLNELFNLGNEFNNLIQEELKKKNKKCLIDGCNQKIQLCHTISKKYLKIISENGNLYGYDQNLRLFSKNKLAKIKLKKIGYLSASGENLFCNKHDSIYNIFENEDLNNKNIKKAAILLHHRVIIYTKHISIQKQLIIEKVTNKKNYVTKDVKENYNYYSDFFNNYNYKIPKKVITLIFKFNSSKISFIGFMSYSNMKYIYCFLKNEQFVYNKHEENIYYSINCFNDENNAYLIISSENTEHYKKLKEILKYIEKESDIFLEYYILFLGLINGNFYFQLSWINNINTDTKFIVNKLLDYITIGIIRKIDIFNFIQYKDVKFTPLNLIDINCKKLKILKIKEKILKKYKKNHPDFFVENKNLLNFFSSFIKKWLP